MARKVSQCVGVVVLTLMRDGREIIMEIINTVSDYQLEASGFTVLNVVLYWLQL
jgi:hypothetical protein